MDQMDQSAWLTQLQQNRAIAVVRSPDFATGMAMAQAVYAGGMKLIEITWNSDRPIQLVETLRQQLPDAIIGAGTVTRPDQLRQAIAAGAAYIVSPGLQRQVLDGAIAAGMPVIPGATTPTEILTAWQLGATCVKVFPVHLMGGARYIKSLRDPLDDIPLMPTGGVTLDNAADLIAAGAIAVGLAGDLFPPAAIAKGQWDVVAHQAQTLMHRLKPYVSATGTVGG
jgi:2-dehydro-3-deoxyphosphogluconate aldolase / (4S)-4-hydroxy-2-oxoglutarate aldolase